MACSHLTGVPCRLIGVLRQQPSRYEDGGGRILGQPLPHSKSGDSYLNADWPIESITRRN